jgi:hypothetical protein
MNHVTVYATGAITEVCSRQSQIPHLGTSVVRQTDGHLWRAARAQVTFSRMSEALAVQMKSFGLWLWWVDVVPDGGDQLLHVHQRARGPIFVE